MHSVKAALDGSWSQCGPGSNSTCNALEFLRAKVFKLEEAAHELPSALCNDHHVRLRDALQARRKIWRLANDGLLLRSARPDQVAHNHQTRCDTHTRLHDRVGLQSTHCSHQLQRRSHGPLCVVQHCQPVCGR